MNRRTVNEGVTITSLAFRSTRDFTTYPRRMEFQGRAYTFQNGLQYLIKKGGSITRIFDMVDNAGASYRLKCDDAHSWTLLAITE
ncbi:MAG TPA: hypothetical protein VLG40_03245 [Candidatus Saccharimonas sp.]|nr:hypothetical protein [Candidatus Saccharimonas sp.]